jgi:hypothetical protein
MFFLQKEPSIRLPRFSYRCYSYLVLRSSSRHLTVFSGIGIAPEVMDVRAIRLEPFALPQRPALVIGVSGEHRCAGAAAADAALCRVPAGEQLNLGGHQIDLSGHRWECSDCRVDGHRLRHFPHLGRGGCYDIAAPPGFQLPVEQGCIAVAAGPKTSTSRRGQRLR